MIVFVIGGGVGRQVLLRESAEKSYAETCCEKNEKADHLCGLFADRRASRFETGPKLPVALASRTALLTSHKHDMGPGEKNILYEHSLYRDSEVSRSRLLFSRRAKPACGPTPPPITDHIYSVEKKHGSRPAVEDLHRAARVKIKSSAWAHLRC